MQPYLALSVAHSTRSSSYMAFETTEVTDTLYLNVLCSSVKPLSYFLVYELFVNILIHSTCRSSWSSAVTILTTKVHAYSMKFPRLSVVTKLWPDENKENVRYWMEKCSILGGSSCWDAATISESQLKIHFSGLIFHASVTALYV